MCQGFRTGLARRVYSSAIGKMLFTQDSTKLQKLCPYLHVVSLLRDQIPGRAWNPDNSSFDPVPVGSTTRLTPPGLPSSWPCLRQRTSEDHREEKKNNRHEIPVVLKKKKYRCFPPAGWIVILISTKKSHHKKCLDCERTYFAILSSHGGFIDRYIPSCKYVYGVSVDWRHTNQ